MNDNLFEKVCQSVVKCRLARAQRWLATVSAASLLCEFFLLCFVYCIFATSNYFTILAPFRISGLDCRMNGDLENWLKRSFPCTYDSNVHSTE